MKYIIWGAGNRGRQVLDFLGSENVVAFIDEKRMETTYLEHPVIRFREYIETKIMWDALLVVSPVRNYEIRERLKEFSVTEYVNYDDIVY